MRFRASTIFAVGFVARPAFVFLGLDDSIAEGVPGAGAGVPGCDAVLNLILVFGLEAPGVAAPGVATGVAAMGVAPGVLRDEALFRLEVLILSLRLILTIVAGYRRGV